MPTYRVCDKLEHQLDHRDGTIQAQLWVHACSYATVTCHRMCTTRCVCTFAMNALRNMAVAHDVLIAERVFQQFHADKHRCDEPDIWKGELVYLSTKNLSMPKGRANKLVPQFIGPYKVKEAYPSTSNYELDLPPELVKWHLHGRFHVNLLRPHHTNNDVLFPSRTLPEPYDFSTPSNTEWYVDEITGHHWQGWNIQFQVKCTTTWRWWTSKSGKTCHNAPQGWHDQYKGTDTNNLLSQTDKCNHISWHIMSTRGGDHHMLFA
jgi:hypothetical protein